MNMFWYKVFYGFCRLLTLLPLRCLYLLSDFLFVLTYFVVRYRRKVVKENLCNSFPEKTERERRKIARKYYRYLCDLIIEIFAMTSATPKQLQRRLHFNNLEIFDEQYRKGKQIFLVTGHYGNWEWLCAMEHVTPYHHATIYHPLENKLFDKFFYNLRSRYGSGIIPMNKAIREIHRYHQKNELTMMCVLSDQSPPRSAIHYWTTFLNQETSVYLGTEKLARHYNSAVMYCEVLRVRRGYYEASFTMITENAAETAETEITEKHVHLLEETIRRNPQYWLWSHRRWKHKRRQ